MKIETGIQSNCSEATIRIKLVGQNEKAIRALEDKLTLEFNNDSSSEEQDWEDQKPKREFDFSEGYVNRKKIFGTEILEITGDAPYNYAGEIRQIIAKYLPKAELEFSE